VTVVIPVVREVPMTEAVHVDVAEQIVAVKGEGTATHTRRAK